MGRRKEDPLLQAAKGFPGRRRKQVEHEIDVASEAAESQPATSDNPFPVPDIFLKAPVYWGEAVRVWREQSEVLRAAGRRRPGYRRALARYCIWTQFYVSAAEQLRKDLPKGGASVKIKKGDGEWVYRTHPNIDFMAKAETALRLLDAEFGFTPVRDQDLVRTESFNASQGRLNLPGGSNAPAPRHPAEPSADPMDLMTSADSLPPGARPN
jgi:phage terminase small subunit